MNVSTGCFTGNRTPEGVVRDFCGFQIMSQPQTFWCVRKEGDVYAIAMIEPHRSMYRCFAFRADGERFVKLLLKCDLDLLKVIRPK